MPFQSVTVNHLAPYRVKAIRQRVPNMQIQMQDFQLVNAHVRITQEGVLVTCVKKASLDSQEIQTLELVKVSCSISVDKVVLLQSGS